MTLSDYFTPNSVFVPEILDLEGSAFKDNCVKTNKHRPIPMATLKSDLSLHNLTFEDAIELALDKSLWRLLVASGAIRTDMVHAE